ncbi:Type I restriction-modification system [Amycolatopsis camponoti]|uniref:Type I restriction-modification system n=1 Tax=Amycolatopsis camponoti TaxID=2606593 RepID=A0A6I8M7S3_9PSEU|nr:Type I restriction-modification system [Amycolatopsis camponoti]
MNTGLRPGWRETTVRRVLRPLDRQAQPGLGVITAYRDGIVTLRSNRREDGYTFSDTENGYQEIRPGDLVFHALDGFAGAVGVSDSHGNASPVYHVCEPVADDDLTYLARLLRHLGTSGFLTAQAPNVRERSVDFRNWSTFARIPLALPPADEQRAIAGYLDRETARIDTLTEEQQRLIELLRERRHSLVDGVFGVQTPNSRLQNACVDVVDCPHTTPEVSDDSEYEAVRTASVRDGKFRPGNGLPVDRATWENRNAGGAPAVGDILFTREAPAGEACMVPHDRVCLGQRMVLLRIDDTVCVGEFLLWQIYSDRVQDHFLLSANGSTVANVRLPVLRTTPIWLPDLTEQRRIAAYLDEQTAKIDTLIAETERFIELARERRAVLITAAVTGQIDVREMV